MKEKLFAIVLLLVASSIDALAQFSYSSSKVVDLGLSVKWAGYNIGANSPEDIGGHYAWGDITGNKQSPFKMGSLSAEMNISDNRRYDMAQDSWGGS